MFEFADVEFAGMSLKGGVLEKGRAVMTSQMGILTEFKWLSKMKILTLQSLTFEIIFKIYNFL